MKIILYVFSGTGNTLSVAGLYKKYFENYGDNEVDIYRISCNSGETPSPDGYDLVGVGYPIHAFSAPELVLKLCRNLPCQNNKRTFIFKTSGEGLHINDCSSQKCIRILQKKGYDVVLERHIVMPYNMIYRHRDEMAKQMWIYAQALTELNCREILKFKREKVKRSLFKRMLIAPIGWIERRFAHLHGTAFSIDDKKCVNCGKCVKSCPVGNIVFEDGRYKFGHKCVLCMGCAFGCPKDAVNVGVFKFWKVNGSYRLNELAADRTLAFPFVPNNATGVYRLYKKYYRECDEALAAENLDVKSYI